MSFERGAGGLMHGFKGEDALVGLNRDISMSQTGPEASSRGDSCRGMAGERGFVQRDLQSCTRARVFLRSTRERSRIRQRLRRCSQPTSWIYQRPYIFARRFRRLGHSCHNLGRSGKSSAWLSGPNHQCMYRHLTS